MIGKQHYKGEWIEIEVPNSILTKKQTKEIKRTKDDTEYTLSIRYDDDCGNGHNTFHTSIESKDMWSSQREDIIKLFPEYVHLIKWNGCSSDGPTHYLSNTIYFADDRDCYGKRKGEVHRTETKVQFDDQAIHHKVSSDLLSFIESKPNWEAVTVEANHSREPKTYSPKYTFSGMPTEWYKGPFDTPEEANQWLQSFLNCKVNLVVTPTSWSKGKEPELDTARRTAIWENATIKQLTDPKTLMDRLPALLTDFKAMIESLNLIY